MKKPTIIEVDEGVITCPTCGKTIVDEDGPSSQPSCDHVRFFTLTATGSNTLTRNFRKN
jgi:rubrerythrin